VYLRNQWFPLTRDSISTFYDVYVTGKSKLLLNYRRIIQELYTYFWVSSLGSSSGNEFDLCI
jgi:hypothetical protein